LTIDPEEVRPKPYDFPWKLVICTAIVGLFLFHCFCGVFIWLEVNLYEKRKTPWYKIEEKCEVLEKVTPVQKQHDGLISS
jgi:hypothetical protein